MRAKFAADQTYRVTLEYDGDDYFGEPKRVSRTFSCPMNGGYVLEFDGRDWKQVCDRLSSTGSTLHCSSRSNLLAMIRREYKAMRRADKRREVA